MSAFEKTVGYSFWEEGAHHAIQGHTGKPQVRGRGMGGDNEQEPLLLCPWEQTSVAG